MYPTRAVRHAAWDALDFLFPVSFYFNCSFPIAITSNYHSNILWILCPSSLSHPSCTEYKIPAQVRGCGDLIQLKWFVTGWAVPSASYKPVLQVALSMVLAFFLLELLDVLHKGNIVFSVRVGLLLLGEADKTKEALLDFSTTAFCKGQNMCCLLLLLLFRLPSPFQFRGMFHHVHYRLQITTYSLCSTLSTIWFVKEHLDPFFYQVIKLFEQRGKNDAKGSHKDMPRSNNIR